MNSTRCNFAIATAAIFVAVAGLRADDSPDSLTIAVKQLAPPAALSAGMEMRTTRRPPVKPTTPAARFPQYQLDQQHRNVDAQVDPANPAIRFLLALPHRMVLIQASVTIDGRPFRTAREQRVEQLLKELQATSTAAASPQTGSANGSTSTDAGGQAGLSPVLERLQHTATLTGKPATAAEVHWILNNWSDGPVLLWLNRSFQRFRANQRPEFVVLDRNRDGVISAEEFRLAIQSFQECDVNRDELVQFTEIAQAATGARSTMKDVVVPQLIFLPGDNSTPVDIGSSPRMNDGHEGRATSSRFDANHDGQLDSEELKALQQVTPDLGLSVTFDTQHPEQSRMAVVSASDEFAPLLKHGRVDTTGIVLTVEGFPLNFIAVQSQSSDQVSIGVVNDGYPILPAIDLNDDGRLTIRELRAMPAILATFDANQDGELSANEIQAPIRICIGLGPHVHQELAGIRSVHVRSESFTPEPDWFVRMDRNKDHDLTRAEFPGTDEQFQQLDTNKDDLISSTEAAEFDAKMNPENRDAPTEQSPPASSPAENSSQEKKP